MTPTGTLFLLLFCYSITPLVHPHGRLIEPPSRASAWRYGFSTPPNYNDHELYCGGFSRQWQKNEGKCGVCGDAWDMPTPRPHEIGGAYGQGVIVRKYNPRSMIVIRVELTEMPCPHCVLQWIYTAGNNWGNCPNGTGAVGCGPQEEFRACADIAIGSGGATEPPELTTTRSEVPPTIPPSEIYNHGVTTIVITAVTLFVVVVLLAILYVYYYQVGKRIKSWLKRKDIPEKPVPPPRARRVRPVDDQMYNISLDCESLA